MAEVCRFQVDGSWYKVQSEEARALDSKDIKKIQDITRNALNETNKAKENFEITVENRQYTCIKLGTSDQIKRVLEPLPPASILELIDFLHNP